MPAIESFPEYRGTVDIGLGPHEPSHRMGFFNSHQRPSLGYLSTVPQSLRLLL